MVFVSIKGADFQIYGETKVQIGFMIMCDRKVGTPLSLPEPFFFGLEEIE